MESGLRAEIIEILSFNYHNYTAEVTPLVLGLDGGVEELYSIATDSECPKSSKKGQRVLFRAAYIIEYIYFNHPQHFEPLSERFFVDSTQCQNGGARRSFAKVLSNIIKTNKLPDAHKEPVAQSAASWLSDPEAKIAVKVWAMSILAQLRHNIGWIDDMWDDFEAIALVEPTAGMVCRAKRGWL